MCVDLSLGSILLGHSMLPHIRVLSRPLQVDLLSSSTSPSNKVLAMFWGVGGFAAALALHVLQPG